MSNEQNKTKHTPGPWYYARYDSEEPYGKFLVSRKGERSIVVTTGGALSDLASENEANARLIAAAPDMLEALIMALPYVETALEDQGYKPNVVDRMCKQIRAAIAKAEGKE